MDLNYRKIGTGKPSLYILHGLLGTADNWHILSRKYAEQFTVITPDLRNHGASPHTDLFTYDLMVADMVELIQQTSTEPVYLIGHSMGGKVAMSLALNHPQLVAKLVVADMRPHQFLRGHDHIFKALFSLNLSMLKSRGDAEQALQEQGIESFGEIQFLLKNLSRDSQGQFVWKPNIQSLWNNYNEIIKEISGPPFENPTLFIKGGMSDYVKPEHFGLISKLFPKWQLATIEHAGHWLHADAPDAFFNKTMQFLNA